MAEDWQVEEMVQGRNTIYLQGIKIDTLKKENEKLTRDLENTQVLLNLCLDTLKRNGIGLNKK